MPTKKDGTKITWKEFFSLWFEGMKNLTPEQRISNEVRGLTITNVGFIISLIALIIYRNEFFVSWFSYGLILVFVGSIWNNTLKWFGLKKQLELIRNLDLESEVNDLNKEEEKNE